VSHALADEPPPLLTIEEFDALLEAQRDDVSWELIAGRIVGMTNPTIAHELIAGNLAVPLDLALRGGPCRVYRGGVRVQRSDDSRGIHKPRPDVMVHCGPVDQRKNYVTNPMVVVEVLSPRTMDDDRGEKLRF
jgi:Uma2 family endonuclease